MGFWGFGVLGCWLMLARKKGLLNDKVCTVMESELRSLLSNTTLLLQWIHYLDLMVEILINPIPTR